MNTLVELLETSVGAFGPNPALLIKPSFRYRVWTYADLWEDSGRVATFLQEKGVRKGDCVLIRSPNMPQWVVALFGILRIGAIAVPLDVRSAPDFVARVVDSTKPRMAFTSRFSQQPLEQDIPSVHLEELDQVMTARSPTPEKVNIEPDDLAEIMFTSGTTGEPKGVELTHRNIVSNAQATTQTFPGHASDRLLSLLPLSHMLEQTGGMLVPLLYGSRIVYPISRQPTFIFKALQENHITVLLLVPQVLQLFMAGIERQVESQGKTGVWQAMHRIAPRLPMGARRRLFGSVHRRMGGKVRCFLTGAAYLDPDLAEKWENLGIPILEGYGATEASPAITFNSMDRRVRGSVGRALPGQEIRIAEDGEILTRGPNVTPGYWQNQAATASAFEGDWYKTGDLGYLDEAGNLYLRGRKKDLIVLANGQNVYPEDIERLLNANQAIKEGVVVGLPDEGGGGESVHAVLLTEGSTSLIKEVVEEVNGKLADHQRISGHTIWPEEDFPRTHTMKVRKGLVVDFLRAGSAQNSETSASNQKRPSPADGDPLTRIISQVAQMPVQEVEPGKTLANDLGLDSLKRVELLSLVEQELSTYIDEALLSPTTTVAELKILVEQHAQSASPGLNFYRWPLTPWCTVLRATLLRVIVFPWLSTLYRSTVTGQNNLEGVKGPVLFAMNHNAAFWDSLLLLKALPGPWRSRACIAAAAEITFGKRWLAILASLVANAFPLSRDTAIRPSLEHLGGLLDKGWNVGIFPEGEQILGQEMLPFQSGIGLLGVECRISIIPVRLVNQGQPQPGLLRFRQRETVSIRIGAPITFKPGTSYIEATNRIEHAVRSL